MTQVPDNRLVLRRAADTCKTLDNLRYKLHILQKKLAKARANPSNTTTTTTASPATQDQVMTGLLNEAYALQFQISTLLAATEEPIPERQRIPSSASTTPATREQEHITHIAQPADVPVA
ncbi:hypothetical protein BGX29_000035 [Mortierella sp. GBA35]|nr:hypothetical protein BGX29_000035 [Mortierella sp. GBA35]